MSFIVKGYSQSVDLSGIFQNKTEIYFSFSIKDRSEISVLTKIISIDNVKNNIVYAYANKNEFKKFMALNYNFTILPNPSSLINPKMFDVKSLNSKSIQTWDAYPTYSAYETIMTQFAASYPSLCKIDTIGVLASGKKLLAAKISKNVNTREYEPQFLYTSSMHGDEVTGYVLMLELIDYLLSNYGTNPNISSLLDSTEIYICPLANPDGTYAGGDTTVLWATRENKNLVDLNRNYPDPNHGLHPDGNAWQQETQFFMNYAQNHDFVMAANFHGGSEVVNYPWDNVAKLCADNSWWQYVSKMYADTVFVNSTGGYMKGTYYSGISDGFVWYEVDGGRQDYMNYWRHCREETIELSDIKIPTASTLPTYWNYNYKSFLNYIKQSTYGIKGIVTDSLTGVHLKAMITINSHDFDSSEVYTSLPIGNYHRPILAGTYSMTVSSNGYISKTINNLIVSNFSTTIKDVQLVKSVQTVVNLKNDFDISIIPNPSNGNFNLQIKSSDENNYRIRISNILGVICYDKEIKLNKNENSTHIDISELPKGIYFVKINFNNNEYVRKLIVK